MLRRIIPLRNHVFRPKRLGMFCVIGAAILYGGCDSFRRAPEVFLELPASLQRVSYGALTTNPDGGPQRLTKAYFARLSERNAEPAAIDLTQGGGADTLVFSAASGELPQIHFGGTFDAEAYNELHVRMRTNAGQRCAVRWQSDTSRLRTNANSVTTSIVADGDLHTYEIALTDPYDDTWSGRVDRRSMAVGPDVVRARLGARFVRAGAVDH